MTFSNKYVERLTKEWQSYGKIIIGVDFDSTISPYKTIDNVEDIYRCCSLIKRAKSIGAYVVIHTCCSPDRYVEITDFVKSIGINVDSINKNPIKLPFGHQNKPYANIFLDDRAGFIEAMDILEEAMNTIAGQKNTESTMQQVF